MTVRDEPSGIRDGAPRAGARRWEKLLERIGTGAGGSWPLIQGRYREPGRAYHTLSHIDRCLGLLDAAPEVPERDLVEAALWLHDLVYDPAARNNEAESARVGGALLRAHGVPPPVAARVERLILVTKHDRPPAEGAEAWIADIDLSILGADPATFAAYDRDIRREYAWMSDGDYRKGRLAVLESFLARDPLFRTDWFRRRFEAAARRNLRHALDAGTPA